MDEDMGSPAEDSGGDDLPRGMQQALTLISDSASQAAASFRFLAAMVRQLGPVWAGAAELQEALSAVAPPVDKPRDGRSRYRAAPLIGPVAPPGASPGTLSEPREPAMPRPEEPAWGVPEGLAAPDPSAWRPPGDVNVVALILRWPACPVDLPGVHRALDPLPKVEELRLVACSRHSVHIAVTAQGDLDAGELEDALARVFPGSTRREGTPAEGLVITLGASEADEAS